MLEIICTVELALGTYGLLKGLHIGDRLMAGVAFGLIVMGIWLPGVA